MASFLIASAGVSVSGTTNADAVSIVTAASAATIRGYAGNDTVTVSATNFNDSFAYLGEGNDTFNPLTGSDVKSSTIILGADDDDLTFSFNGSEFSNSTIKGNEGKDTIALTLTGVDATALNLAIEGNAGNDVITLTSDETLNAVTIGAGKGTDTITAVGAGTLKDATIAGGLGDDTLNLGMNFESSLLRLGQGVSDGTDSADTITLSGSFADSSLKGGAGDDTITADISNNSDSWIIEGNAGDDLIDITAGTNNTSIEIRGGSGDDTVDYDNAAGSTNSAEIYGGKGDDLIRLEANTTGLTIWGGAGQDSLDWVSTGAQTYGFNEGDSTFTAMDVISASTISYKGTGRTVAAEFAVDDLDIIADGSSINNVVYDGDTADIAFSGAGLLNFAPIASASITDVTAAVGFLNAALTANEATLFAFSGAMVSGSDVYMFVKGSSDDLSTVVKIEDMYAASGNASDAFTAIVELAETTTATLTATFGAS